SPPAPRTPKKASGPWQTSNTPHQFKPVRPRFRLWEQLQPSRLPAKQNEWKGKPQSDGKENRQHYPGWLSECEANRHAQERRRAGCRENGCEHAVEERACGAFLRGQFAGCAHCPAGPGDLKHAEKV